MRRTVVMFAVALMAFLLQGCSAAQNASVEGAWIAKQATQTSSGKPGDKLKAYEFTHYNYWEIRDGKIEFSKYGRNAADEVKIVPSDFELSYEIRAKRELVINGDIFEFTIKKDKMTIRNHELEVQFEKGETEQ